MTSVVPIICFALLGVAVVLILGRLAIGPSLLDRVVATDALLVTIACGIAVYCAVYRDISLEPVLLVVALLAFVGSVSVARYIGGMLVVKDPDAETDAGGTDVTDEPAARSGGSA